jgi:predicted small secreted protein
MFKRIVTVVALIAVLLIVAACNMPGAAGVKDCGEDMQCFTEAAEKCDPAKVVFPIELEMMGIKITSTSYQEIVGEEDGLCVFKILSEGVEVEFTEEAIDQMLEMGLTQEMIDEQIQMTEEAANQEQLNQICRVDTEHLADIMAQWTAGEFSTEDWTGMECEDIVVEE